MTTGLTTLACSTCAQNFSSGDDAAGWAILFMLVVVLPILIAISFFIIRIARKQAQAADDQYNDPFYTQSSQ